MKVMVIIIVAGQLGMHSKSLERKMENWRSKENEIPYTTFLRPARIFIKVLESRLIWFGVVLQYINRCRLFNAKSSLFINSKYI